MVQLRATTGYLRSVGSDIHLSWTSVKLNSYLMKAMQSFTTDHYHSDRIKRRRCYKMHCVYALINACTVH